MMCLRSGVVVCVVIGGLAWSGCAAENSLADGADESGWAHDRDGRRAPWNQGTAEDALVQRAVEETLAEPLTPEAAVMIGLLRNRSLQNLYEELGIAQKDLVLAGLLESPFRIVRGKAAEKPEQGGGTLESGGARSFLGVLFATVVRRTGRESFESMKPSLARRVLDLALAVEAAYYGATAAGQIAEMRRQAVGEAEAAVEEAKSLQGAGKPDVLDVAYRRAVAEQSKATYSGAEAEFLAARDRLSRLAGLQGSGTVWRLIDRVPDPSEDEAAVARCEELALSRRLDLGSLRKEGQAIGRLRDLVRSNEWPARRGGPAPWMASPRLSRELPLLDLKEAVVLGLESRLHLNEVRVASLEAEIRSDVRGAAQRLELVRSRVRHVRDVLIPLRRRIVELTRERYRLTHTGGLEFADARQKEIDAVQQGIEAARDYWIIRSELERATEGDLVPPTP